MLKRLLVALVIAGPASLAAQTSSRSAIAILVADTANAPVADADVAIVRGTADEIAHGTTDSRGRVVLSVPRAGGAHQVIVRKIGFERAYRFFSIARDTIALDLTLRRTVVALEAVKVSAEEDLKQKSYHLTAEDIENSARPIIDGSDIFKLRPDMMNSRGGPSACLVYFTPRTGWIESVWVNGQRVTDAPVDSIFARNREAAYGIVAKAPRPDLRLTPDRRPKPMAPAFTEYTHIDTVLSILHLIKPEHIAEITYHDCFDQSVGKNNSDLAMFIVLKPGTGFDLKRGSYVVDDSAPVAPAIDLANLPRHRFRVLGVFDAESGDPVPNVSVTDSATGDRAATTATGTVSLFFIPEGRATLRLHHDGYRDTTFTITISPADTIPLTAVMTRVRSAPPDLDSAASRQYISTVWGGWPRG